MDYLSKNITSKATQETKSLYGDHPQRQIAIHIIALIAGGYFVYLLAPDEVILYVVGIVASGIIPVVFVWSLMRIFTPTKVYFDLNEKIEAKGIEFLGTYSTHSGQLEVGLVITNNYENKLDGKYATLQLIEFSLDGQSWEEINIVPTNLQWQDDVYDYISPGSTETIIVARLNAKIDGFIFIFSSTYSGVKKDTGNYRFLIKIGGMVKDKMVSRTIGVRLIYVKDLQTIFLVKEEEWKQLTVEENEK